MAALLGVIRQYQFRYMDPGRRVYAVVKDAVEPPRRPSTQLCLTVPFAFHAQEAHPAHGNAHQRSRLPASRPVQEVSNVLVAFACPAHANAVVRCCALAETDSGASISLLECSLDTLRERAFRLRLQAVVVMGGTCQLPTHPSSTGADTFPITYYDVHIKPVNLDLLPDKRQLAGGPWGSASSWN